jgi:hypothetical protein
MARADCSRISSASSGRQRERGATNKRKNLSFGKKMRGFFFVRPPPKTLSTSKNYHRDNYTDFA